MSTTIRVISLIFVFGSAGTSASAQAALKLTTAMYLRGGEKMGPTGVVSPGTALGIAKPFLRQYLGKEAPSDQELKNFIRDPGKSGVPPRRIYVPSTGRYENHYLFPVEFRDASGRLVSGYTALNFADRIKKLDYLTPHAPEPVFAGVPDYCKDFIPGAVDENIDNIRRLAAGLQDKRDEVDGLWSRYEDFARRFYKRYGHRISKQMDPHWEAKNLRSQYLKDLIEEFGQEKASLILAAVTAWGEVDYRKEKIDQMADLAAVLKVIENRATTKFYSNRSAEPLLESLGIPKSQQNERLKAILAHLQFSVWNIYNLPKRDEVNPALVQILGFNPDSKYRAAVEKMRLSFEAQEKVGAGKIQFLGAFNDSSVRHYLADTFVARTSWASNSQDKRIHAPIVRVTDDEGRSRYVNLDDFATPKHVFYGGLR